jgi:hypothetical protein
MVGVWDALLSILCRGLEERHHHMMATTVGGVA